MQGNFPIPTPDVRGELVIGPPTLNPGEMNHLESIAHGAANETTRRLMLTAMMEIRWLRHELQRAKERMIAMENAIALERKLTQEHVGDDDPLSRC